MERREEAAAVKKALTYPRNYEYNVRVTHGKGTSWGWLYIYADIHHKPGCTCKVYQDQPRDTSPECQALWRERYNRIIDIATKASGRNAYQAEQISVNLHFIDEPLTGGKTKEIINRPCMPCTCLDITWGGSGYQCLNCGASADHSWNIQHKEGVHK